MRIRRSAARLLGSAYSAPAAVPPLGAAPPPALLPTPTPPPPQYLAPCSAPESRGGGSLPSPDAASGERCELSRSPWDLIAELSLSDPQEEDDLVDRYFVHVTTRASWFFSAIMPAISTKKKKKKLAAASLDSAQVQPVVAKKAAICKGKENQQVSRQAKKKAKVKQDIPIPKAWSCKKNDGRGWQCHRKVSHPDSLCQYHFVQKRSYLNPDFAWTMGEEAAAVAAPAPPRAAALKPSTGSKPRRKRSGRDFNATEGFYYYAGFGFRSKRRCTSIMDDSAPLKQEEEEDSIKKEDAKQEEEQPKDVSHPSQVEVVGGHDDGTNPTAARGDASSCDEDTAGIAGVDEDTSDDDYGEIGVVGSSTNGNGDPRACDGDIKRRIPRKPGRKPVKARSLKSLM